MSTPDTPSKVSCAARGAIAADDCVDRFVDAHAFVTRLDDPCLLCPTGAQRRLALAGRPTGAAHVRDVLRSLQPAVSAAERRLRRRGLKGGNLARSRKS